ncbi:MAG: hypothetical protein JST26_13200 [Bacteroidetes bacterium]|nr:hypothetical protein [Bacteroidota bacterium]
MKKKSIVYPVIIIVLSLLTTYYTVLHPVNPFGFVSLAVGITGVALYFKGYRKYDAFFYVWTFMQVPNIYMVSSTGTDIPLLNAFPAFAIPINIGFGLNLVLKTGSACVVYFNILPIGLYYLLKFINVGKPLGHKVIIHRLRKGTFPQINFPVNGTIEKVCGQNKLTAIYLVALESPVTLNNKSYTYICLEPKDSTLIDLTDKPQICGLRLCPDPALPSNNNQNPFIDWITLDTPLHQK